MSHQHAPGSPIDAPGSPGRCDTRSQTAPTAPGAPWPILGMRQRQRTDGTPYLVHILGEALALPAGAELLLRRIDADDGTAFGGATHALQVILPRGRWQPTKREKAEALADRLDGCAIRATPDEAAP